MMPTPGKKAARPEWAGCLSARERHCGKVCSTLPNKKTTPKEWFFCLAAGEGFEFSERIP